MFRYSNRATKTFITLSSILILSSLMGEGTVWAEELASDNQVKEVTVSEELEKKEKEDIVVDTFYEGDVQLTGQTIFTDKKVRIVQENKTVLCIAKTDSEGRFMIDVANFSAGDYIKIEVFDEVSVEEEKGESEKDLEINEEMTEELSEETSEEVLEETSEEVKEEKILATKEITVQDLVINEIPKEEASEEISADDEILEEVTSSIDEEIEEVEVNKNTEDKVEVVKESTKEVKEKAKVSPQKQTESLQKNSSINNIKKADVQTFAIKKSDPMGKTYHYVRSGDTLLDIALGYGTSVSKLSEWNKLNGSSLIYPGQIISVDGINNYHNIDKETRSFSNTQEFISFLAPHAKKIAREKNLYTSVMLAQAIHESAHGKSGLAVSGNNLFGIKGAFDGNSINMLTWEEINGEVVWVVDSFRLYPSYADSLKDNGDLLRDGLYWNPEFYSGTWVENTNSYHDATEWLTGRYATDSLYASKLNDTISFYNLTAYDEHINGTHPITSEKNLNLKVVLTGKDYTIFKQPKGTIDGVPIGSADNYRNQLVTVDKEKVNGLGKWWHISVDGKPVGYVLSSAFTEFSEPIISEKNVDYIGTVTKNYIISVRPWRTEGASQLSSGKSYYNQPLKIIKEASTAKFNYVLLADKNGNSIGWIDKDATTKINEVINHRKVNYAGIITQPSIITTKPALTSGSVLVKNYKWYYDRPLEIIEEMETVWGVSSLVKHGNTTIGWVEKAAVEKYQTLSTTNVDYQAVIEEAWSINTQPWGIEGYQPIPNYKGYKGKLVNVIQEKTTQKGTYSLITLNGKELGWIDKDALSTYHRVLSTINRNYVASVVKPWSINKQPWGTYGAINVDSGKNYLNENVSITQEKVTSRGTYALIKIGSKELGWIDKSGLNELVVSQTIETNYDARIVQPWSINTKPWGVSGFENVGTGKSYLQMDVQVVKEQVTQRSTYALIVVNGKELGWIDKDALTIYHDVLSVKNVNYTATIVKPWSINTAPWGTKNSKLIASAKKYIGKKVKIIQEKVTPRSTYVLIYIDGKELGWIDKTGISK